MALEWITASEARAATVRPASSPDPAPPAGAGAGEPTGEPGFNALIETAVDAVNPLQHLPVVGSAYRAITNDGLNPLSRMAGGWLFGGPTGLAVGAASAFLEMVTGKDPAQIAMGWFEGDAETAPDDTASASSPPPSDGPLLVRERQIAAYQAAALAEGRAALRPGHGADAETVNWSANIWSGRAMLEASAKYDQAGELSSRSGQAGQRNAEQGGRLSALL